MGLRGEIEPKFIRAALSSGNLWALRWRYPAIFEAEAAEEGVVTAVVNYLKMWDALESSYSHLSTAEKKLIEEEADPFGHEVKFRGFDGNTEGQYLSVALFLINDLDRFSRFKGRDLNSHMPLVAADERMYSAFEPLSSSATSLSAKRLATILKEKQAPEPPIDRYLRQPAT